MSDNSGTPDAAAPKPETASAANVAQQAFGKYKARLAGGPSMMPVMPGWGMPPSFAAMPPGLGHPGQGGEPMHPLGSLTERLGTTVRLGVDLLNAALRSSTAALDGMAAGCRLGMWDERSYGGSCGCGNGCGYDCCEVMSGGCCRPGVHGCGCC